MHSLSTVEFLFVGRAVQATGYADGHASIELAGRAGRRHVHQAEPHIEGR